jgi:hypothetical protein
MPASRFRGSIAALVLFAASCGGGGGSGTSPATVSPPATVAADISILFLGNSHTAVNDVPGTVGAIVRAARPDKTVATVNAPGILFLDERLGDAATLQLLRERRWSFVVLQAQKSSSSWTVEYSTAEAISLVRMARDGGAVPILFPEWPRRGIVESQLLYGLYVSIASAAPACVAPVPQAFDLAAARYPAIVLHADDGNHSSPAGAYLASLVLAATITRASPALAPTLPIAGVSADEQARLREVATDAVAAQSPRQWCPGDP